MVVSYLKNFIVFSVQERFRIEITEQLMEKKRSKIKVTLLVIFHIYGLVNYKFLLEGQTMIAAFHVEVLKHLRDRVYQERSNLRGSNR